MGRGVQVHASGVPLGPKFIESPVYPVHWTIFSFVVSVAMFLNLTLMPMKAYITEDFPWMDLLPAPIPDNFTEFNTTTLARFQRDYSGQTLPKNTKYYEDPIRKRQISRAVLNISKPVALADCTDSVLLGLPGVAFYGPAMTDLLCSFAAANHTINFTSHWHHKGTCIEQLYLGVKLASKCLWLTSGNEIDSTNQGPNVYTLSFAIAWHENAFWNYVIFVYRILYNVLVLYLLWSRYYKHCWNLRRTLQIHGHSMTKESGSWSYSIMVGDPTAIILSNSFVVLAFMIDLVASFSSSMLSVLRASQHEDVYAMLIAFLYMARGVWFPYFALSITSSLLKKFKIEHLFAEVDPTLLILVTTMYASLLSYCSANIAVFLEMFYTLQLLIIPTQLKYQCHDESIATFIFASGYTTLPILYGFLAPILCKRRVQSTTHRNEAVYCSLTFNPVKTRIILGVHKLFSHQPNCMRLGGAIHALCHRQPRYKTCPSISFSGADCFILCYRNGVFESRIRLSLLSILDLQSSDPTLAIPKSALPSQYTFNELMLNPKDDKWELRCSKQSSAWCT